MGGNALKHLNPARLTTLEVVNVYQRVDTIARGWGIETHLVPWCFDKDEHGDVDILVCDYGVEMAREIARKLGVEDNASNMHLNGNVLSIAVPLGDIHRPHLSVCQVDLILTKSQDMRHTRLYYGGGGLGMMLGRVADHYGFVFAQEGLRLRSDPSVNWSRDILLTNEPIASLLFLGYDIFKAGAFETEVECWKYALSSPRAKPYMFMPSQTNAENRSRDKQRPNHLRFEQWLLDNFTLDELTARQKQSFWMALSEAEITFRDVRSRVEHQELAWTQDKEMNYALGMGAVKHNWANISDEDAGPIIRLMQKDLPDKATRKSMWQNPAMRDTVIRLAQFIAFKVAQSIKKEDKHEI